MKTEHIKAIDAVCAWPNLTLLPNGDIVATIWNQPCHGLWEGDLDCWSSEDGGRTWRKRAQITQHEPGNSRFNCATGLAQNGDLLTIVSGWNDRKPVGQPRLFESAHTLQSWIMRSSDGGFNWTKTGELPRSDFRHQYIPFGDLQAAKDGALCFVAYLLDEAQDQHFPYFFRSYDDGASWDEVNSMDSLGNETAILCLGEGRWIAASREESDKHLELMISDDDARIWCKCGALTKPYQVPGHLLRLRDGRILLSYGNRIEGKCGVEVKFSDDGENWSEPLRLADMPMWDGGYPSSVERDDGMIVTAFYANHPERGSNQYQMDVVLWRP